MALEGGSGGEGRPGRLPPTPPGAMGGPGGGRQGEAQAEAASAQHLPLHVPPCPLQLVVFFKSRLVFFFLKRTNPK